MKSLLLLPLSFLLLLSLPNLLMADNPEPLYDSSNNIVVTGTKYYLVPAFNGEGGGFYADPSICPGDIFQNESNSSLGQAIKFYTLDSYEAGTVLNESTNLKIHFYGQLCLKPLNAWIVSHYDDTVKTWIITAYGSIDFNLPRTLFKFEKVCNDNVYVILFDSPTLLGIPKSYVGVTSESKRRPALISVPPLRLKIVKAPDAYQVKEARLKKARIASVV